MQLTKTLVAAILAASTASAAPTADEKSMMAAVPQWTFENMERVCKEDDSCCTWKFSINTHLADPTNCVYKVEAAVASHANGGPSKCGGYTITSGWSGQFGPGNGFTVLSVVDDEKRLITYPSYTDKQVEGGNVVKPDQSYAPAALP
ncbi:Uncharacterized protein TPAR_07577 [Tolypocladium paradoxum]|uniref:Small secreted protein n=1 Tax=Tolypocladium paradoxum TaxID=94208 RepID=A0A2S4KPS9_9HYPO|nr:Uncharacterized protein TPAR_07577 [Tolypocladium paradoxum]